MYSATKHGKTTYLKKHQLSSILEKIPISVVMLSVLHPEREGGGSGGTAGLHPHSHIQMKIKETVLADTMIQNVLRDLPLGRNPALKSANDNHT